MAVLGGGPAAGSGSSAGRVAARKFPSVFQAWSPADNLPGADPLATVARHDLIWHSPAYFGLEWDGRPEGLATAFRPASIPAGLAKRGELLRRNPNMILLAEIRYRDAWEGFLGKGHKWWKRDAAGEVVMGWKEGGFIQLDFADPEYQDHVAARAGAAVESGVFDGVMIDWWQDDDVRLDLVRKIRRAVGEGALIVANANDRKTPRTAPYINGYFMECYRSASAEDWVRIRDTLVWAEENLRLPRVNCVETWYHGSREDLSLMRAVTTLVLTHSDGYVLFSDPNDLPTPDHRHDWYGFWDRRLGKPRGRRVKNADGTFSRDFDRGVVVYNPMGNRPVEVSFPVRRVSAATGKEDRAFPLGAPDGDIYLAGGEQER